MTYRSEARAGSASAGQSTSRTAAHTTRLDDDDEKRRAGSLSALLLGH